MKEFNNENLKDFFKKQKIFFIEKDGYLEIPTNQTSNVTDRLVIPIDNDIESITLENIIIDCHISISNTTYYNENNSSYDNNIAYKKDLCIKNSKIKEMAVFLYNLERCKLDNVDIKCVNIQKKKYDLNNKNNNQQFKDLEMLNVTSLQCLKLNVGLLKQSIVDNILQQYGNQLGCFDCENMLNLKNIPNHHKDKDKYMAFKYFKKRGHFCYYNYNKLSIYDDTIMDGLNDLFPNRKFIAGTDILERYLNEIGANQLMKTVLLKGAKNANKELFEKYVNKEDKVGNRLASYCKTKEDIEILFKNGYFFQKEDMNYLSNNDMEKIYQKFLIKYQIKSSPSSLTIKNKETSNIIRNNKFRTRKHI